MAPLDLRPRTVQSPPDPTEFLPISILAIALSALALSVVLVGSLAPGNLRPRTRLGGYAEHALAYMAAGISLIPLLASQVSLLWIFAGMVALAAIMEVAQIWISGRSCHFTHFLASCAGIAAALVAWLAVAQFFFPF